MSQNLSAGQEIKIDGRTYIIRRVLACGIEASRKDQPYRTETFRLA